MTIVSVSTRTHSVVYVADNILKSVKDIIRLAGLDPSKLVDSWDSKMLALKTWLGTGDLERVVLEIYNPYTNGLVGRWDIDVIYNWDAGDGSFWTDTEQIKYHIKKAGLTPADASYDVILHTKRGRPDVPGWSPCSYRPTDGMVRHSLGSTIEHNGLGANAAYWRKA